MSFFTSLALAGLLCSLPVHCTRAAEDTFVFQGKQNTPYLHNSADSFVKGGYLVEYLDDGTVSV